MPQVDFYEALRAAGVPTQISVYPGESPAADETHLFHIPSNRRAAMLENLAWFTFWLKGGGAVADISAARLASWQKMAAAQSVVGH